MKKATLTLLLFCTAFAVIHSKGKLRWAADAESGAPYAFQNPENPKELIGFEVDIIKEVAKHLGLEPQHFQNEWDGLIPGLSRADYEVAINGLEITEDRQKVVNFSIPYYITYQQIVVRKNQEGIRTLSDLIGKKVGTLEGSLAERMLRAQGGIIVKAYDSEQKSYGELEYGRLDAVLIDQPVALYYAGWNPQLKLVGQPIGEVAYGIVTRKQDTVLLSKINESIIKLKNSGRLREILESWNMWSIMMASYLNDMSDSNTDATQYKKYLEYRLQEVTLWDMLKRYYDTLPTFGEASLWTLAISITSMLLAILVGLIVAITRVYAPKPFSSIAVLYIELVRGTPLLVQLYLIYYGLPNIGIELHPFVAAMIGLGLNYGAYEAENYRAGIFSVPKGQMEAAISLGMTRRQALRHVIMPQAIRLVIPPVTNDFISLLKDSSLVSVIAMVELTKEYNRLAGTYYDYIGFGILVAIIYLLIGFPFVRLSKYVERKFSLDRVKLKSH